MTQLKTPKGITIGHGDHGLQKRHLELIDKALEGWDGQFIKKVVPLEWVTCFSPNMDAGDVTLKEYHYEDPLRCELYGPSVGDDPVQEHEVTYKKRGNRPGPSRMIAKAGRTAKNLVIIAGPTDDGEPMLYTAYGTRADKPAPQEWWDPSMKPLEAIESAQFWSQHALSKED